MKPIFVDPELADFRNYLFLAWEFLGLPAPTPRQYEMADALQTVVRPLLGLPNDPEAAEKWPQVWDSYKDQPTDRVILEAFRGIGKSWISGVLVTWCLGWRPDLNILVVSGSGDKSEEFTTFTKQLISEWDLLSELKPGPKDDLRWSSKKFDVKGGAISQAPSVRSASITGTITGGRADLIIPDDVETPNTSETQAMRGKLAHRITEFDAILKPGGVIVYLGTPQCEDSTYAALTKKGYRPIIWPARYPSAGWMKTQGPYLAKTIKDEIAANPDLTTGYGLDGRSGAVVDSRFCEEDLKGREASYGRSGFALQFMLDTTLSDADRYPLKLSDLIVTDLEPDLAPERPVWSSAASDRANELPVVGLAGDGFYRPQSLSGDMVEYHGSVMTIDPAGKGPDEMAYCVLKQRNGYMYLHEITGIRGNGYSPESLLRLANAAKTHRVNKILIESNFGDGMFSALLKPVLASVYPCTIEEVRHSQQKERRIIETLEPLMNQHRLVVDASVILKDRLPHPDDSPEQALHRQLFYQMTRITKDRGCLKHDDRLDVLSMAAAYFSESTSQDAEKLRANRDLELHRARMKEITSSRARTYGRPKDRKKRRQTDLGFGF